VICDDAAEEMLSGDYDEYLAWELERMVVAMLEWEEGGGLEVSDCYDREEIVIHWREIEIRKGRKDDDILGLGFCSIDLWWLYLTRGWCELERSFLTRDVLVYKSDDSMKVGNCWVRALEVFF
jgi:hypothetical protein